MGHPKRLSRSHKVSFYCLESPENFQNSVSDWEDEARIPMFYYTTSFTCVLNKCHCHGGPFVFLTNLQLSEKRRLLSGAGLPYVEILGVIM